MILKVAGMSDTVGFRERVRDIQRHVGVAADGIFGPLSAAAVWRDLNREAAVESGDAHHDLDARTMRNIDSLDVKARDLFVSFARRAAATAATLGCDYVAISGNRSWEEQDALYAQGRSRPGSRVTNARGGQSNHNFGIALDFGVFRGVGSLRRYLDTDDPALAAKVHKACSEHAASCGLVWGGSWTSFKDLPHFEVDTGLSMVQKRARFKKEGSVL